MKDKLKNDIQQLQRNHKADIREREQIEHLLNRDLNAAKDEISKWLFSSIITSTAHFSRAPKSANRVRTCLEFEKRSGETVGRTGQWVENNQNSGQFFYQSTERETRANECSEGKTRERERERQSLIARSISRLKWKRKMLDYVFKFKSWRSIWKTMNWCNMISWNSPNRFKYVSKFERCYFSQEPRLLTGAIFLSWLFLRSQDPIRRHSKFGNGTTLATWRRLSRVSTMSFSIFRHLAEASLS